MHAPTLNALRTDGETTTSTGWFRRNSYVLWLLLLTISLSFGWFFVDGSVGINLADEGFLWYGTQALKAGLVPFRDFQSYDPGRYVWTATWSYLLGDGVVALRAACVIFQCFGVLAGLLAARRVSKDWKFLLLVALVLVLWMHPRYKVFEQSISLAGIYAAVLLIERPSLRRHFSTGVFVGMMAFMGRNHGLYLSCSFSITLMLLAWSRRWENFWKPILIWGTGVFVGYLPQLFLFAYVPGYFDAYIAQLRYDLTFGTNIACPIPWPWEIPAAIFRSQEAGLLIAHRISEGCLFLIAPAFLTLALLRILRLPRTALGKHALFIAAACVTLSYTHYTFSRADHPHLAHSVPALILGIVGLSATFGTHFNRWLPSTTAFVLSLLSVGAIYPWTSGYAEAHSRSIPFVDSQVAGESMRIPVYFDRLIKIANYMSEELAKPNESILFLPHTPGLYAATKRLSPTKLIYYVSPSSAEAEEEALAQIRKKQVGWVLLQDIALDGRDDMRFIHTNPIMTRYFKDNFERVPTPGLPSNTVLLHRRE